MKVKNEKKTEPAKKPEPVKKKEDKKEKGTEKKNEKKGKENKQEKPGKLLILGIYTQRVKTGPYYQDYQSVRLSRLYLTNRHS